MKIEVYFIYIILFKIVLYIYTIIILFYTTVNVTPYIDS